MKVLICNIIMLAVTITAVSSKSYDLEAEALRLFGDELPAVLQGFRKSMEYVKILSDRIAFFKEEIETMGNGLYYHEVAALNTELRLAVSGCESNGTRCLQNYRRRIVESLPDLSSEERQDPKEPSQEAHSKEAKKKKKRRTKKNAEDDDAMKAINFVSTAMRKKALEKYRAVFNPKEKLEPFSLSKAIEDYGRLLRNKTDTDTTKNGLKYLNDYPLRKYNKNKYVDIAFKHAKQLIVDIISTFKQTAMKAAARTFIIDMNS